MIQELTQEAIELLKKLIEIPSFLLRKIKRRCKLSNGSKPMVSHIKEPKIMFGQLTNILITVNQSCY